MTMSQLCAILAGVPTEPTPGLLVVVKPAMLRGEDGAGAGAGGGALIADARGVVFLCCWYD